MKNAYSAVFCTLVLIGCNPDSTEKFESVADCEKNSDPNNSIVKVDSQFQSYPLNSYDDLPLDMELNVYVYPEGISENEVEAVYLAYPDGSAFERSYIGTTGDGDPFFVFPHAAFSSYSKTDGLSMAPMTDYCVQFNFVNGDVIAKRIDMERADGTVPNPGEQMVHDSHYELITSGGDYSRAMAVPMVDTLSISESGLTIAITLNDIRAVRISGSIIDSTGENLAEFYLEMSSGLKNDGKKTYSISYGDLESPRVSPSELALSAHYVVLSVEDDWNLIGNDNSFISELNSRSGPVYF